MFIIERKQDLDVLKDSNIISKKYMKKLENQFTILFEQIKNEEEESLEEFSLQPYGYLILLEKGDNLRNLSCVGLDGRGGLLASTPEFINQIELPEQIIFEIIIVYNNSYAVTFYVPDYIVDDELQKWLDDNM